MALLVFMDIGILNPPMKIVYFLKKYNLNAKSFILSKRRIPSIFLFFIFTGRGSESLPDIKLLLKCFPGEKRQPVG